VAPLARPVVSDAAPRPRPPIAVDHAIAAHLVALLPEEPTLQFGPGGVAEAIIAALDRPVRIWSGLVTDARRPARTRAVARRRDRGIRVGGRSVVSLAEAGKLILRPVHETHDLTRVSRIERFVGCNTALQVGLNGSVNVERVGGRLVAGIGGHPDFCAAASRSPGGLTIVALPSTTRSGASAIVPVVEPRPPRGATSRCW